MKIISLIIAIIISGLIIGCGTPNDPESVMGGDGGYKIIGKCAATAFAQDVVVKDSTAYLAQGEGGLLVADISNPAKPKIITTITSIRGYNYKIALYDSIIYLASGTYGVNIIDISNPINPIFQNDVRDIGNVKDFGFYSKWLLIATSEVGVTLAENSFPTNPDVRGSLVTPGFAQGIAISIDSVFAIIASGETGLAFFDFSQIQGGSGFGSYYYTYLVDVPGYAENVTVNPNNKIAYVACGDGGLSIVDYSDSANVKMVGNFKTGGYAKEVFYSNNKIYVTTELRGLQIINVANPAAPYRIGTVQTQFAKGVTADDNYIYVADENEGLIVISIPH